MTFIENANLASPFIFFALKKYNYNVRCWKYIIQLPTFNIKVMVTKGSNTLYSNLC